MSRSVSGEREDVNCLPPNKTPKSAGLGEGQVVKPELNWEVEDLGSRQLWAWLQLSV